MRLGRDFYERDTLEVARSLIGSRLIRRHPGGKAVVIITETEAYKGTEDPASHAHRGVTPRNKLMFGPPGRLYVYFSYGMHHCMNVVTEKDGVPGAVLLRAAAPLEGQEWIRSNRPKAPESRWMDGPGKLTQALSIGMGENGYDLTDSSNDGISLEAGSPWPVQETPRIGISKGQELLWRFVACPS
jgi:DNA-3-methyladenine glycosylase